MDFPIDLYITDRIKINLCSAKLYTSQYKMNYNSVDKGNNQSFNGQYLSKSYNSMFLYFWDIISARTFLAVSVAQPTRIRIDVPANPRNAVKCAVCSTIAGPAAKIAKNVEPRTDIRLRTCTIYYILY